MTQFTWTYDAPTGTYKNHAISSKIFNAALAESVFMDHVDTVEGFGRKMGESVTLVRIKAVTEPESAMLSETQRIPEDEFSMDTKAITVHEMGRSVPFTNLAEELSKFSIENPIQKNLRNQIKLVLDTMAATAFKRAPVKYIPTGSTAGTFDTDGTPSTSATSNMNVYHVEEIRDYLWDTLKAPPAEGGDYIGIFRTLAMRGIKRDANWEKWHMYTDPQAKYNGEVGRIENVRFVETNHSRALGKIGTSSVLGEGVIFGAEAVAMAEVHAPELRAQIPQDFGRSKAVAWYGILNMDIIWDTANEGEAKIVHIASS